MQSSPSGSGRKGLSSSPATSKKAFDGTSPASQYVRGSTLGVASPTTRHSSMPGFEEGTPSPKPARSSFSKKRLDPSDPSTWTSSHKPSFSERPRAASETVKRAEVPTIQLESDVDKAQGDSSAGVNLDGSSVAPKQKPSADIKTPEPATPIAPQSAADSSPSEPQKSPTVSSTDPASPENKDVAPSSPKDLGLAVPKDDSPDNRRFSNQSASFSSVTTDSDRVGRTSYESDRDNENVLQETSDESSSSSGSSDEDEEVNGSSTGERGRKRKSDRGSSKSPDRRAEESPKEPASPVIRVEDVSDNKQEHPHPPDDSGKLSETKPKNVTPKSGRRRAPSPAALSATGDDDAELRRAKELVVKTSPVDETVKDRSVKMIIRGEWESFQDVEDEETEFRHEPRLYLVCSDLSSEASHALEWTVGTLLKDGDTLLIISGIEDENAPKHKPDEEPSAEIKMESVKAAQQAGATMESLTRQTTNREGTKQEHLNTKIASLKDARSPSRGSQSRPGSRRGHDRVQAIERLEQDFMKFVRKTTLQVRTMIEVLHCRSSRHLMLNAIDELEPTLVVVGTRGQSSIQGVMMGSFSNYLVTKSSVPVMVARRRLKKPHHAKISSQQIRLTNNLIPFGVRPKRRSLTSARID